MYHGTQHAVVHICRLLQEPDPALSQLPGRWLGSLLDAAAAPQQSVDNIIRRSAGGPFAVTAILLAEPPQQTQKVCPTVICRTMASPAGMPERLPWSRSGGTCSHLDGWCAVILVFDG